MKRKVYKFACIVLCIAFCVSSLCLTSNAAVISLYNCGTQRATFMNVFDFYVTGYVRYYSDLSGSSHNQLSLYSLEMIVETTNNTLPLTSYTFRAYDYPSYTENVYTFNRDISHPAGTIRSYSIPAQKTFPLPNTSSLVYMLMSIGAISEGCPEAGWDVEYRKNVGFSSLFTG